MLPRPRKVKICPRCEQPGDFYPDATKAGGSTYCKPCTKKYFDEYRRHGRGWKIHLLCAARKRARAKSIPFEITVDDFEIPEFCPILGVRLIVSTGRGPGPDSASLDRINPALGYISG